ncbi:MAG: hypothetical protein U9Q83_11870 [Bacteroidota bacterium]|nr:hypothetical protein [Bacteroidota bacterium]
MQKLIFIISLIFMFFYQQLSAQKTFTGNRGSSFELSGQELTAFKESALQKTKRLGLYIQTITDKSISDYEIKKGAVNSAVKLFMSEENVVQVSSKNSSGTNDYPIRQYLNKIRVLQYSKINITWYDIGYVSEFRKGPDGKYNAVITVFQKFTGYQDNIPIYSDITQKNIHVTIDKIKTFQGERMDVLLGDITVEETK